MDEKLFVFEHWHEGAEHMNGRTGAFFTPPKLASDFRIDVCGDRIIDLCAGIGVLSFMAYHYSWGGYGDKKPHITCVEINPAYVMVGKKLLSEAAWVCEDVFDFPALMSAGKRFDHAIANPPFGRVPSSGRGPSYTGPEFEYKIIDLASQIAEAGTFILPQGSAGFRYSGAPYYRRQDNSKYLKFHKQTGIHLDAGCGVDTSVYKDDWKGSSIVCEIVCTEFENLLEALTDDQSVQQTLFEELVA